MSFQNNKTDNNRVDDWLSNDHQFAFHTSVSKSLVYGDSVIHQSPFLL